jgi:hypothetical protein
MKAVIDDGLALPLPEALKMEIERGSKNNSAVTPAAAEESRKAAMERGREQAGCRGTCPLHRAAVEPKLGP